MISLKRLGLSYLFQCLLALSGEWKLRFLIDVLVLLTGSMEVLLFSDQLENRFESLGVLSTAKAFNQIGECQKSEPCIGNSITKPSRSPRIARFLFFLGSLSGSPTCHVNDQVELIAHLATCQQGRGSGLGRLGGGDKVPKTKLLA